MLPQFDTARPSLMHQARQERTSCKPQLRQDWRRQRRTRMPQCDTNHGLQQKSMRNQGPSTGSPRSVALPATKARQLQRTVRSERKHRRLRNLLYLKHRPPLVNERPSHSAARLPSHMSSQASRLLFADSQLRHMLKDNHKQCVCLMCCMTSATRHAAKIPYSYFARDM